MFKVTDIEWDDCEANLPAEFCVDETDLDLMNPEDNDEVFDAIYMYMRETYGEVSFVFDWEKI